MDTSLPQTGPSASRSTMNYEVVAQSAEEVQDTQNSPAVSMGPYLVKTGQEKLLTSVISIYSERGASREQVRLLYLNDAALRIWREIGLPGVSIGKMHRPSRTSTLLLGVPYSD